MQLRIMQSSQQCHTTGSRGNGRMKGRRSGRPMNNEIAKLKVERDHWRAECQRAANERDYLLRFLSNFAEALVEGNYARVREVDGGPTVDIIARYPSLFAALQAIEGAQTLRRIFRLDRLGAATSFQELKIDIDVSR
jgi:hypothetical protein